MNQSEKAFKRSTQRWGEHNKTGWPDFLCIWDGQLVCVEVKKYADDYLTPEQEHVMSLLSKHMPCYRWDTELGLKPYDYRIPGPELRQLRDKKHNEARRQQLAEAW